MTPVTRAATAERVFRRLGFGMRDDGMGGLVGEDSIITAKFQQACNDSGFWLLRQFEWPFLRKVCVIATQVGVAQYAISEGTGTKTFTCDRLINDVQWDMTNQWRFVGDVGDDIWYSYKYGIMADPLMRIWRTAGRGVIEVAPTPTVAGEGLAVPFITDRWVWNEGITDFQKELLLDSDSYYFDWDLFDACVQWRLMESLGLDYAPHLAAAMDKLNERKASYRNSGTLSLAPRRGTRMLGYCNVPQTGYGS